MATTIDVEKAKTPGIAVRIAGNGPPRIMSLAQQPTTGEFCDECKSRRSKKIVSNEREA